MSLSTPIEAHFHQPAHLAKVSTKECSVMGIVAHADDLEIISGHEAYEESMQGTRGYFGVVLADGAGPKPRAPRFASLSREEMTRVRMKEQFAAADTGEYGGVWMFPNPSSTFVNRDNERVISQIRDVIAECQPETIYTHNPLDGHKTHVAVYYHVCAAIQQLAPKLRPKKLYGGEVWGMISRWHIFLEKRDQVKVFDVSRSLEYLRRVLGNFASQNEIMGYSMRIPEHFRVRAGLLDPYQSPDVTAVCLALRMHELLETGANPYRFHQKLEEMHREAMEERHAGYGARLLCD
jgi:LmbE family N-acetylglucosaminyl deacetylase